MEQRNEALRERRPGGRAWHVGKCCEEGLCLQGLHQPGPPHAMHTMPCPRHSNAHLAVHPQDTLPKCEPSGNSTFQFPKDFAVSDLGVAGATQ